jgi:hypothetical protein
VPEIVWYFRAIFACLTEFASRWNKRERRDERGLETGFRVRE